MKTREGEGPQEPAGAPGRRGAPERGFRVLLADDHKLVRAGLRALFEQIAGVAVVGEADNGLEAVRLAEELRPDLAVVDVTMPGLNGLEVVARLVAQGLRAMVVSMHLNEEYVMQALQAGAMAYMPKDSSPDELRNAVDKIRAGSVYMPPQVMNLVAEYLQRTGGRPAAGPTLTGRQRETLKLIAEGKSTKGIAHSLGVSVKTVETHRAQLMERLDIRDVPGLVRYALRQGIIGLEG